MGQEFGAGRFLIIGEHSGSMDIRDYMDADEDEDTVTISIDPHVHSEGSYDAHDPVDLLLEQAADIGLDGIVITDHDTIEESLKAAEMASDYGLIGIPGVEVSTRHGHVLAIGVEEMPTVGAALEDTVQEIRDLGGVAIIAHPFQFTRHGARKKHIADGDAIEVYNAWLFTGYRNRRAMTFARNRDYPQIGSSDAHSVTLVGRAYTEIEINPAQVDVSEISPENIDRDIILQAIRDGSTDIHGTRKPIHSSVTDYTKGAARKAGYLSMMYTAKAVRFTGSYIPRIGRD